MGWTDSSLKPTPIVGSGHFIHLHGIDAPERRQTCTQDGTVWPCGRVAIQLLLNLLHGRVVTCTISGKDRLGLAIGVCFAGTVNINRFMVSSGYATAYRRYSPDYIEAETTAKKAKLGIWAGQFVPPWDWRQGIR